MEVYLGNRSNPSVQSLTLSFFVLAALSAGCGSDAVPQSARQQAAVQQSEVVELGTGLSPEVTTVAMQTEVTEKEKPAAESAAVANTEQAPTEADQAGDQSASEAADSQPDEPQSDETQPKVPEPLPAPEGAKRLSPDHDVWLNVSKREVYVGGNVSLRRGALEMFACTRNTKEHESVISANTLAFTVHAALLRLGAKPGKPVQWDPEYKPPTGTEIEINVEWRDADGKLQKARAQDWVRDMRTGEPMQQPWVFAGSWTATHEVTGETAYMAEGGDFICVSNFSTATLDVPAESSQSQEGLLFEAFTERIPPLGAPVRLTLRPKKTAASNKSD